MGRNASAEIRYGFRTEEGTEFPWGEDLEDWWRETNGYKAPFELYDDNGEYIGGKEPAQSKIDAYYDHRFAWEKENQLPVELYFTGPCDYSITFLGVPNVGKSVDWGDFERLFIEDLAAPPGERELKQFLDKYEVPYLPEAGWYMMASYG